jgi:hypothetical protein
METAFLLMVSLPLIWKKACSSARAQQRFLLGYLTSSFLT